MFCDSYFQCSSISPTYVARTIAWNDPALAFIVWVSHFVKKNLFVLLKYLNFALHMS